MAGRKTTGERRAAGAAKGPARGAEVTEGPAGPRAAKTPPGTTKRSETAAHAAPGGATDAATGRASAAAASPAASGPPAKPGPAVATAVATVPVLRKKQLIERVAATTGARKRDVKPVVEATLMILGNALASGEQLALPPLGKAKVNRQKDLPSGEMLMVKLRRPGPEDGEKPD